MSHGYPAPPDPDEVFESKIALKPYREVGIDIETTSLKADLGMILCICAKVVGENEVRIWRLDDYDDRKSWEDTPLVEDFCDFLEQCAMTYGWNTNRFDIRMLRTRRLLNGKGDRQISVAHCDLLPVARQRFNLRNNRLATWTEALKTGIDKTPLDPVIWQRAEHGDEEAMDQVVDHCIHDVKMMEKVYLALAPWIRSWTLQSI